MYAIVYLCFNFTYASRTYVSDVTYALRTYVLVLEVMYVLRTYFAEGTLRKGTLPMKVMYALRTLFQTLPSHCVPVFQKLCTYCVPILCGHVPIAWLSSSS